MVRGKSVTHWVRHQSSPCWRQEVSTGSRKYTHKLLQRFELQMRKYDDGVKSTVNTRTMHWHTNTYAFVLAQCCNGFQNYRFGLFLKIAEQALDVFEVRGKRSIMKGKIPLPGCAALWHKNRHLETVPHKDKLNTSSVTSIRNARFWKDLQSKSFLRPLPLDGHTYTFNGRPWQSQIYSSINTPEGI